MTSILVYDYFGYIIKADKVVSTGGPSIKVEYGSGLIDLVASSDVIGLDSSMVDLLLRFLKTYCWLTYDNIVAEPQQNIQIHPKSKSPKNLCYLVFDGSHRRSLKRQDALLLYQNLLHWKKACPT